MSIQLSKESLAIAEKLLMMNNQDLGRYASGGYGFHKQAEFQRDLRALLNEILDPPKKWPFVA